MNSGFGFDRGINYFPELNSNQFNSNWILEEFILNCNLKGRGMKMCSGIHILSWARASDLVEESSSLEYNSTEFQLDIRGIHSQ